MLLCIQAVTTPFYDYVIKEGIVMFFFWKVLQGASLKKCHRAIQLVHKRSDRNGLCTLADMLWCALRYGAGYHDYALFGFEALTGRQRNTYVTRARNKLILDRMNQADAFEEFNDKQRFVKTFAPYLGREIVLRDCVDEAFMHRNPVIFAKPSRGCGGEGIERLYSRDFDSSEALKAYLQTKNLAIIEAQVLQHPHFAALHPASVNTLRIVTDQVDGKVHIAYVLLKIGRGNHFCDNTGKGGMFCRVDPQKAIIISDAVDDNLEIYTCHPESGYPFVGFPIPYMAQALELVCHAALVVPEIGHIGWDVAITASGPIIIEGNPDPGVMCQFAALTPEKVGLWPYYKRILSM